MKLRAYAGLFVFLFLVEVGFAGSKETDPFGTVSPDELKMTTEPLAPGAPAIILYRQVDRNDTEAQSWERNYRRIKILTQEGLKYANVEIQYAKGNGRGIEALKARTVQPDGTVVNFDGKLLTKEIVKAKGMKYIAKTFTLPDVRVGSIIEYSYIENFEQEKGKGQELTGIPVSRPGMNAKGATYGLGMLVGPSYIKGTPNSSRWIVSDELFTKLARFSLTPYEAQDNVVRWFWSRLPKGTRPPKATGSDVIRMEAKNIPACPVEDFMPPANELKARVDFIYSQKLTETNPEKYWSWRSQIWNSSMETFVGKRKAMEELISQIVSPDDAQEVKLQKIYARVQQLRNTSFEVEKSEKELEQEREQHKLRETENVEDVWNRGYGDRVQLTWLFLALARAAGFEAHGAWVSSRRDYFFNKNAVDEKKLSANVVLVKLDGKDLYFDPGAAFTPYGLLPWEETGVPGRLLAKDGGSWVTTSLPDASLSRTEHKGDFRVNKAGDLEGNLTLTLTGLEALQVRSDKRYDDDADRKKFLEDMVREQIPSHSEVQLTNKPEWHSSSPSMVAEFSVKIPAWVSSAGNQALLPVGILSAGEKEVFVPTVRKHPIYFRFPFSKQDDIKITLPSEWQVSSLAKAHNVGDSPMLYTFSVEKDGSTIHLSRTLKFDRVLLDPKYYAAFQSFFRSVRIGDEQKITLQRISLSSSDNKSGD